MAKQPSPPRIKRDNSGEIDKRDSLINDIAKKIHTKYEKGSDSPIGIEF